ncbi:MAG: EAL domain-containing protein [Sphingomicrobium sp.]
MAEPRFGRTVLRYLTRVETLLAFALIATGLAIIFREPLTRESMTIAAADADQKFYTYVYDSSSSGSHSRGTLVGPMEWSCNLPVAEANAYCGFGLQLDLTNSGKGIDLSRFDSFDLDVEFHGEAEFLRAVLKNHLPAEKGAAAPPDMMVQGTIPIQSGEHLIAASLPDFVVAQWWKDATKDHGAKPKFNNIIGVEFGIGNDSKVGEHRLRIKSIRFNRTIVPTETWYGGIAVFWMALIGFLLLSRRHQIESWKRELAARTLNSVPQVIFSIGPDGWPDFVSKQWAEHYGGDPSQLLGRGWLKVIHPEDRRGALRGWVQAFSTAEPYEAEFRVLFPDGSYRWAEARARPDHDVDGKVTRWFGTWTESNERVLAEQALKASERLHRGILEASADCIAVLSPDGTLELMNSPGIQALELSSAERITGCHWTAFWQRDAWPIVGDAIARAANGETVRFRSFCPTAKGTPKWWDVVLTPMLDETSNVKGLLAISRDVTSDREKSEQLRWASEHDALTLLPNRRAFQARLQAATLRAMETGEQIGLLIIDLDHFKHINDSLGHSAGDDVLRTVAERLRVSTRDNDFVARVGGDEFAVILEHVRCKDDVLTLSQKIFSLIQAPMPLGRRVLSAGASIGGALFPEDAQSANDLFKAADTALYALKGSGRGGTMLFHGYMLEEVEKAAAQLSVARDALTDTSVVPVYQPKVDIQTGAIVGFEALLRWRHPTKGLQLPETVEEAFKDYELAAKIGDLMQRAVARDLQSWLGAGLTFGRVSINASPAEFLRDDYAERLLTILAEHQIPAHQLEIEVTEHALLELGPAYVARALAKLKEAGVSVSLDDFGTGYSSLSHLRDFPVDLVKIDKSFVEQMTSDAEIGSIVAAVINLARSIEIEVVAEGVETPAQLDLLRSMGCHLAQGHLFGRAIEKEDVLALLQDKRVAA